MLTPVRALTELEDRTRDLALVALALLVAAGGLVGCGGSRSDTAASSTVRVESSATIVLSRPPRAPTASGNTQGHGASQPAAVQVNPREGYRVGERVLTFTDRSRLIRLPNGRLAPRRLVTVVRYPEGARGSFPLVVFGHGFAVTPAYYARLLHAWARAGYVVAAPVFPLTSEHAPGGPHEADIVNQPGDMSFVITRMLAASADPRNALAGLIDPRLIAVSGQSDGGETALATAYDEPYLDHRVDAAIILSGARLPGSDGFDFPRPSPPLLAVQGTADTTNPPSSTYAFFNLAPAPKYLLKLLGAGHLPPYTTEQPQLSIVERVTIAFLERYLEGERGALGRLIRAGNVSGLSMVDAQP